MGIDVRIVNGKGSGSVAHVTNRGEMIVNDADYSLSYNATVAVADTAYNFVGPVAGKQFVIKNIFLYGNISLSAVADTTVNIYEADSPSTTTVSKDVITTQLGRQVRRDLPPMNLIISAGKWVNIKASDATVYATILGYYVDEE